MKSTGVQVIKNVKAPASAGVHFRLLCMTGSSKGTSYYIKNNRIVLGRSDNCDIKVLDTKSSREHAEIVKVGSNYVLTDLKSQNGTMVNDLKVNQHTLKDGDKIIIGQTVYKYNVFKIEALPSKVKEEIETDDEESEEIENSNKKKKPIIYLIAALVVVFVLFLDDGESPQKNKLKEKEFKNVTDDFTALMSKKRSEVDKEVADKLDNVIHRGLRELREGNYFRAMAEFNLALVLSPNNGRASFYMNKTKQALDNEIESYLIKARRDQESLKYMSAIQSYCNILRLLDGYGEDDRYKKAKEEITQIAQKMGLEEGEIACSNNKDMAK